MRVQRVGHLVESLRDLCIMSIELDPSIVPRDEDPANSSNPHDDFAIVRKRRAYLCLQVLGKYRS